MKCTNYIFFIVNILFTFNIINTFTFNIVNTLTFTFKKITRKVTI